MSTYTDFKTNLDIHPISGDIVRLSDSDAIANEIRNLVFTDRYERFWDPEKGAGIPQTLFDNFGVDAEYMLETRIKEVIDKYVTRAKLIDVKIVQSQENGYSCTIVFQPQNALEPTTINMVLKRVR